MTQEEKDQIRALVSYPEYRVFEKHLLEKIAEYTSKPLDRSGDVAAQALAKEDTRAFITDLFASVHILAQEPTTKTSTHE